eukprot:1161948-Pelagomonas_calceolata.AAC.9
MASAERQAWKSLCCLGVSPMAWKNQSLEESKAFFKGSFCNMVRVRPPEERPALHEHTKATQEEAQLSKVLTTPSTWT